MLGGIADLLRKIERDSGPEFLPRGLDVMGLVRQLALPSAETVEKLSYGDPLFRMPTQSNIPITTDKGYLAEVLGMAPVVPAASRATTRISNEVADQLVKAITRNPEATAVRALDEIGRMSPVPQVMSGSRDFIRSSADNLANELNNLGFQAKVQHSGSRAGPSSYVQIYDPETGRFFTKPIRFSGHGKGPFEAAGVIDVQDPATDIPNIVQEALQMRGMGPSTVFQKQAIADELIAGGMKPKQAYAEADKRIAGLLEPQAMAPKVSEQSQQVTAATQSDNFKNWFGDWQSDPEMASKVVTNEGMPKVVYHGTQRPDRIGTQFRKSRATSGPMSFFTDNPEIASGYAKGKQDTSLAYEDTNYASWFKKKEGRSTLNLEQVGARMSSQEKQEVIDKLRRVGMDDQGNIVVGDGLVSDQTFDFMLKDPREGGGNPLKLANKLWLESGTLYGREEEFSKVLNAIGLKGFEQDFPTASYPAIYPVYLDIKNPLDTSAIDGRTMYALEYNAKRQRKSSASGGADQWDKMRRDPKQWIEQLKEDTAEGKSSMVWTSIPDWVTKTLKAEGYDGIKDVGGKSGGNPHEVWIPFEENQVKSATGNVGKFSKESKNILRGAVPTAGAGLLGAGMYQDEQMY